MVFIKTNSVAHVQNEMKNLLQKGQIDAVIHDMAVSDYTVDYVCAVEDMADLVLVAPATANTINKVRFGLADNMLTNLLLAISNPSKVVFVPAMNVNMYINPTTEESIEILKYRFSIMNPAHGHLACGYGAEGKFPSIGDILDFCKVTLHINSYD